MARKAFPSRILPTIALLFSVAIPVAAGADTLLVEGLDQAATDASSRPQRGMNMAAVEANWGTPQRKRAAVGDPPIARWDYPAFTVYFEYSRVLHAVRQR